MLDHESGTGQRRAQRRPTPGVALTLLVHVRVVAEGSGHRRLHRGGHHHAGVSAHLEQLMHQEASPATKAAR